MREGGIERAEEAIQEKKGRKEGERRKEERELSFWQEGMRSLSELKTIKTKGHERFQYKQTLNISLKLFHSLKNLRVPEFYSKLYFVCLKPDS